MSVCGVASCDNGQKGLVLQKETASKEESTVGHPWLRVCFVINFYSGVSVLLSVFDNPQRKGFSVFYVQVQGTT